MIKIPGLETYFGGKGASGTYQKIINQLPPHDIYIEPFLGAGNILRRKKPASKLNWGMDMDERLIRYYESAAVPLNFKIVPGCALSLIHSLAAGILKYNDTVLIYLDPPYLHETRKSNKRYNFEMSKQQHERMLMDITGKQLNIYVKSDYENSEYFTTKINEASDKVYIVISHYECDLYNKYLDNWRRIDFNSITRGGLAVESLYMNYAEPTELHQYDFLGDNYREREKIQNQIKRNVERLQRMPPLLRNAIVTNIKENF